MPLKVISHKRSLPGLKWEIEHQDYGNWLWDDLPVHKAHIDGFDYPDIATQIRSLYDLDVQYQKGIILKEFKRPILKCAHWFDEHVAKRESRSPRVFTQVDFLADGVDIDVHSTSSYQYSDWFISGLLTIDEGVGKNGTGHALLQHPSMLPCKRTDVWEDGNVPLSLHTGQLILWPGSSVFNYVNRHLDNKLWVQVCVA